VIDARGRGRPEPTSPVTQAPTPPTSATAPITIATPEALRGFGEALNGCAPERYADLALAQKARCGKPGEGLAVKNAPNLMGEKSQVKNGLYWQEEFNEAHWQPRLCQPGDGIVAFCLMHQAEAESQRAAVARQDIAVEKTKRLRPAPTYTPPPSPARP
jgi:hypothetical protein